MASSDIVIERWSHDDYTPSGVIGIAFDIETIGGCMTKNARSELGAVAIAIEDHDKKRVLTSFEGHMKIPEGCGFEERCEKEFWDVHKPQEKANVLACQTEPQDVIRAFVNWVYWIRDKYGGGEARNVRFLTDAAYFDAGWMSYYLTKYADHHPMHTFFSEPEKSRFKPVIDTNAFFRGLARAGLSEELKVELGPDGWFSADKAMREALDVADDDKPDVEHDHRAVHDAESILKKYLIALKYMNMPPLVLADDTDMPALEHGLDAAAVKSLNKAFNYTPHTVTLYANDKKTVVWWLTAQSDPLRLVEAADSRLTINAPVEGVGSVVPCIVGESSYTGLNHTPHAGPIIVPSLVADYLIKTGFEHPIFCPDTNPASVVRDDEGNILGTTRMVLRSSGKQE